MAGYQTGAVIVLNCDPNATNADVSSAFIQVVASIALGNPMTTPNPIQVAVTPDSTRASTSRSTATAASR